MPKSNVQDNFLTIPKIDIERITITLEGTAPLITRPSGLKPWELERVIQEGSLIPQPLPWEYFSLSGYWISPKYEVQDEADWLAVLKKEKPRFGAYAAGIKDSAVVAAYRLGLIKNRVQGRMYFNINNTVKDNLYNESVVEIISEPPVMKEDEIKYKDRKRTFKTYTMMFEKWSIILDLEYISGSITSKTIKDWFEIGGKAIGIGQQRPERGGEFGTYEVI